MVRFGQRHHSLTLLSVDFWKGKYKNTTKINL
jgi:hypothetical protein